MSEDPPAVEAAIGAATVAVSPRERERWLIERLRTAEDRFADLSRLVSDWLWETDRELRLTYLSPRIAETLDYHPRELAGRGLLEIGSFVADRHGGSVPDIALHAPFREAPYVIAARDGRTRHLRLTGVPVFSSQTGRFLGYRGTARDTTAEIEALANASRSDTKLKEAIESVSEGFVLYDPSGRLVQCNQRIKEYWYGIAHRLVPGARLATIVRAGARLIAEPHRRDFLRRATRRRLASDSGLEVQLNEGRWLRITDRRLSDGSTVSIHTDITAAKQREDILRIAKESAEQANRAKSAFIANMSHELRTPLNAIIGFSEIMRDQVFGPIGNPIYQDYAGNVVESANHLLQMINDILDVAKAEAGRIELEDGIVRVDAVVGAALRLVREGAERHGIRLSVGALDALPPLRADERRLKQILINLLSNAIKFTERGGTVAVSAVVEPAGTMAIGVADTGIGIAPEHIADALDPFGQVDNELNRRFQGTGLGLPLSRALTELHGGAIELTSAVGQGTTVTVRLPKERVLPQDAGATPPAPAPERRRLSSAS